MVETEHHIYHRRLKIGIFFILVAWIFFTLTFLVSKLLGPHTTISMMIFFRGLIGTLIMLPWMIRHAPTSFRTSRPWLVLIRALAVTLNIALIFLAVQTISLVDSTLLTNTAPLFVPFLVMFFLKEKLDHKLWAPIFIGLVGIALVLKPDRQIVHLGAFYALASGVCAAVSILTVKMSTATEKAHTLLFYVFLFGLITAIPFAIFNWKIDSLSIFFALVGLGFLPVIGQWFFFKALQYGKATHIAPLSYVGVLYSALYDWFFFNQIPDIWSIIGMICVFSGGLAILFFTKPRNPLKNR